VVEDLLSRLATIKDIKVISRTSSEMFRDKGEKTVPEIGKLLGASHIFEGTVQRVEDDLRISVLLIDTKTDNHILSKLYDQNLSDIFRIQSEIAGKIASELSLALTNTELEKLK
jgi:TolB-like protein